MTLDNKQIKVIGDLLLNYDKNLKFNFEVKLMNFGLAKQLIDFSQK